MMCQANDMVFFIILRTSYEILLLCMIMSCTYCLAWRDDELKMILDQDKKGIGNAHRKLGKHNIKTVADTDANDVRGRA
jgi:hypothetical protein